MAVGVSIMARTGKPAVFRTFSENAYSFKDPICLSLSFAFFFFGFFDLLTSLVDFELLLLLLLLFGSDSFSYIHMDNVERPQNVSNPMLPDGIGSFTNDHVGKSMYILK